ncbi:hypothetical protein BDC45DRAFT_610385 [Circinella umbellata]|nr:hypothetical protein BDC45DRAFT_610385 [Circinella umbellata]
MLANIGDCNLYSLDIGGGFGGGRFYRGIDDSFFTLVLMMLAHSQVATLSFTGLYEIVDDLKLPALQVLNSLLHLQM